MSNKPQSETVAGKSGNNYKFDVHKLPVKFDQSGGVYLFAKLLDNGKYHPIYLGITNDLSTRFDNHHKADCISRNGATHVLTFKEEVMGNRALIEKDILESMMPPCNEKVG